MIDCDVHCAPASWDDLKPYLALNWQHFVQVGALGLASVLHSHAYPPEAATTATPEARASGGPAVPSTYEALKAHVLDTSGPRYVVLNCMTMFDSIRHPYYQGGLASALNDWLRGEWLDRDDRLRASMVVPWSNPEAALEEIERVGDDHRFVQVLLPVRAETPWGRKAYHAMYRAASERGLAVALHAWGLFGHAPTVSGFTNTYVEDYLSNSLIVQDHLTSFVAEGVFERFPDLKLVLLECGFAWIPAMGWRLNKLWKTFWPEVPWVKEKPAVYLRRHVYASTAPAQLGNAPPEHVRELVAMLGSDRLLYASDYPHDHGRSDRALVDALDADTRRAVLEDNAATLYRLNGDAGTERPTGTRSGTARR